MTGITEFSCSFKNPSQRSSCPARFLSPLRVVEWLSLIFILEVRLTSIVILDLRSEVMRLQPVWIPPDPNGAPQNPSVWVGYIFRSVILLFFSIYSCLKTFLFIAMCISIHMCFCILKLYLVEGGLEMLLLDASCPQPSPLQVTIAAVATWAAIGCWKPRKATGSTSILRGWLLMKTMTSESSCFHWSCVLSYFISILVLIIYFCTYFWFLSLLM